jgi:NADH-quinone oxidoreductase subunit A
MQTAVILPVFLLAACVLGLCLVLLLLGYLFNPKRPNRVKRMPYESGMDPIHDARRRFDVRFYLLAIAFVVFDVELLFLCPWAVTARPAKLADRQAASATVDASAEVSTARIEAAAVALTRSASGRRMVQERGTVFAGVMVFVGLLALGFIYDWRKGIFQWQ